MPEEMENQDLSGLDLVLDHLMDEIRDVVLASGLPMRE